MAQHPGWYEVMKPNIEKKLKTYRSSLTRLDPEKDRTELARTQGKIMELESQLLYVEERQKN